MDTILTSRVSYDVDLGSGSCEVSTQMIGRVLRWAGRRNKRAHQLRPLDRPSLSARSGYGTHSSSTPACQISFPMILSISSSLGSDQSSSWSVSCTLPSRLGRKDEADVEARKVRVLDDRVLKKLDDDPDGEENGESFDRSVREDDAGEDGVDMLSEGGDRRGMRLGQRQGR